MAIYIDRDKAIKELYEAYEYDYPTASGDFDEYARGIVPIVLTRMPEDAVVEIVMCKDCKHAKFMSSCSRYMCNKVGGSMRCSNDYCNYGERKET